MILGWDWQLNDSRIFGRRATLAFVDLDGFLDVAGVLTVGMDALESEPSVLPGDGCYVQYPYVTTYACSGRTGIQYQT